MAQLGTIWPEVKALGADLAIVDNGSVAQARKFKAEQHVELPLFVDPSLKTYAALGLKRSPGSTLNWGTIVSGLRAFTTGFRQGSTQGDPWQQGGVFVVLPDGEAPFAYRSKAAGDHPALADILTSLKTAIPTPRS